MKIVFVSTWLELSLDFKTCFIFSHLDVSRPKALNVVRMRKKRFFYIIFIFSLIGLSFLYVNDFFLKSAVMVNQDEQCRCNSKSELDPFEHPLRYKRNIYTGVCIDSCKYRYPLVIETSKHEKSISVANTFHEDQFWVAEIPVDAISQVQVLFENFAPGINHVAFRFLFHPHHDIVLHSQNRSVLQKPTTVQSIVLSPEAAPPMNHKYNLWDGFVGNYALINRLISNSAYQQMAQKLKHPLKSHTLKINLEEAQSLLSFLLLDSKNVYQNQYQLLFNNCATSVIDSTLQAKKMLRSKNWDVWDVLDPLRGIPSTQPIGTLRTLQWWGLIDNETLQ